MELNQRPKIKTKGKKRVGRGYGSGKGGHTAGRGAKGLKARGKVALTFEGTKMKKSFLKKLPFQRGKGKFKPLKPGPVIVNLRYLNLLPATKEVDLQALIKHKIVVEKDARRYGVKILGDGQPKAGLKVNLPCSKGAAEKIKKAGGKIVWQPVMKKGKPTASKPKKRLPKKKPAVSKKGRAGKKKKAS